MPQFDQGFEIFINWQTMLLCLGIFLVTYGLRTVTETARPDVVSNKWWRDVFLPFTPIVFGAVLAILAKTFPWPMPVADNMWAKVIYGAVCGMASGWVYARFKAVMDLWIKSSSTAVSPAAPVPPPSIEPPTPPPANNP